MAELTIDQLTAENADLKKENTSLKGELEKAQELLKAQKEENAKLKTETDTVSGVTVHNHKTGKYRLLFSVKLSGVDVTDEAIKKDRKLLESLIEIGSGAIEKVQ